MWPEWEFHVYKLINWVQLKPTSHFQSGEPSMEFVSSFTQPYFQKRYKVPKNYVNWDIFSPLFFGILAQFLLQLSISASASAGAAIGKFNVCSRTWTLFLIWSCYIVLGVYPTFEPFRNLDFYCFKYLVARDIIVTLNRNVNLDAWSLDKIIC